MQAQVQRCKTIVTGILLSAGEARGESSAQTTVGAFLDELVAEWRATRSPGALRSTSTAFGDDLPIVSDSALKQIIYNVLDNALEASPGWVSLKAARDGDSLVLTVSDAGPGFAPRMLAQLGKPYQSSKGRPGGGLGLFLVVNVARTLGGTVDGAQSRRRRRGRDAAPAAGGDRSSRRSQVTQTEDRLLLIVEDDAAFARTLCRSFERRGYTVLLGRQRRAGGGAPEDAFARLRGRRPQARGRRLRPGLRPDAACA